MVPVVGHAEVVSTGERLIFGTLASDELGFRVQGSGFRVQGSGFRVQGSGFRV